MTKTQSTDGKLEKQLLRLTQDSFTAGVAPMTFVKEVIRRVAQRDQQRLAAVLADLPSLADLPNYEEDQAAKWAGFQDGVLACEQTITTALSPDTSNGGEEKPA